MASAWEVRLLGAFEICAERSPLPAPESARARSLLGYLLLHQESPVPRERLAARLWPESSDAQSRTNLRHVLHTLRRVLPEADRRLTATATWLAWRPAPGDRLDVAEFRGLAAGEGPDRPAALRRAADLYGGDLLEGIDDEWVRAERDRLRSTLIEILHELVEITRDGADGADLAVAVADAERLIRLDPLRESGYRLLMRLHAARGDRAAAVRVFHRCSQTLDRELGVRPGPETEAAYRALLPRPPETPIDGGRRSPLVGRDTERGLLATAWRGAGDGRARLVVLTGDPGMGKSRLAADFLAWAGRNRAVCATASCFAAEGPLPYGVIASWLRSPSVRTALPSVDRERRRDLALLLPDLLLDDPALAAPDALPEDEQRPRVFEAVAGVVGAVAAAGSGPMVLMVDDLHHADRESCRLLHYLLRARPGTRLLVVATARGAELAGTAAGELLAAAQLLDRLDRVDLGPLAEDASTVLIARMLGHPVPTAQVRRLHQETAGNPLFLVEAIRGGWSPGSSHVPVTPLVRAVLQSRIDGLDAVGRELAAAAAVIGRPFDADLLFLVARGPERPDDLVVGLDELWRRGIVAARGSAAFGSYDFTHEALRDIAVAGTGPATRAALHRRVARALEERDERGRAAEIALHHTRGGTPIEAARWYRRAADAAQALYAHAEAIRLLDRAIEAAVATGDDRLELDLRTAQLGSLVSEHGYAAPEVAAVQERALALTDSLAVEPAPPLLRSLAMTALTADDFGGARYYAERLRTTPNASGMLAVEGEVLLGFAAFWSADFPSASDHFEAAVAGYRPVNRAAHLAGYGQDPKAVALARLANTRWFIGDRGGALRARNEAIAWAQEIRHPFTRAAVLLFGALLALDMSDESSARRYAGALIDLDPSAPPIRLALAALRGWLAVVDGRDDAGMARIRRAIADNRTGAGAPGMRAILARIQLAAAAVTGDLRLVDQAVDELLAAGPGAAVWAAEARRLRAFRGSPT